MKNNSKILKILKIWKIILLILIIILMLFLVELWYYKKYKYKGPWEITSEEQIKANNQRIENYADRRIKGSELKDLLAELSIAVVNSDTPIQNSITIKPKEDNKPDTLDKDFPEINRITENSQKQDYLDKINKLSNNIRMNARYRVVPTDREKSGQIIEITIEDADN